MITWKEFKEAAEAAGIKDKDEILYIDFYAMSDMEDISFEGEVPCPIGEASQPPPIKIWNIWS